MGGKFSHKLEVLLPGILLNRNFLKENWQYSHAGWENFGAKIFSKLLLGQCSYQLSIKKSPFFEVTQKSLQYCKNNTCTVYKIENIFSPT
jgi:hypothetical protein